MCCIFLLCVCYCHYTLQESKRSSEDLCGRNDGNIKVIFPRKDLPSGPTGTNTAPVQVGDYVLVKVSSNIGVLSLLLHLCSVRC